MAIMKKAPAKKMQMGGPVPKNLVKKGPVKKMKKAFKDFEGDKALKNAGFKKIGEAKLDTTKRYMKKSGAVKAKNGKSFPDLNKDGKITKADILKGRGVIAKKGASVRKAGFGDMLGKAAKSGVFGLAGMAANKLFGGKKKAAAPAMGAAPMGAPAAIPAVAPMKKGGKVAAKKKMMKSGGKMAKCKYGCK